MVHSTCYVEHSRHGVHSTLCFLSLVSHVSVLPLVLVPVLWLHFIDSSTSVIDLLTTLYLSLSRLPFFVMTFLMSIYAGQFLVPKIVFSVFQWLGWANSLLNPVIYTIFSPDFRNAFKKMLIYNRTGPNSRSSYYLRSARTKVNTGTGQSSNKLHPVPAITADPVSHFPGKKGDRTGKQQQQQQEQSVVPAKRSKEQTGHSAQEARRDLRQMPIEEKSLQSVSLVVSKQEQSPCPSPKQVSSSRESQSSNSPPAVETTHSNDFTSSNRTQTPSSSMSAYL